jgi:NADH:ubiquinone oxidoreductase subunit 6 (subunit J)
MVGDTTTATIFWIFAIMSVVSALCAVLNRSIVYAALALIVVFLSIAGFFVLNNADFLAIAQVIVYAVGITIILLFAIMFTGEAPKMDRAVPKASLVAYGIVVAYVFALLIRAAAFPFNTSANVISPNVQNILREQGSTGLLGQQLFGTYALPFEVASVLLLVAMIGAIILAKKTFVETEDLLGTTSFEIDQNSALPERARADLAASEYPGDGSSTIATRTNPEDETKQMVGVDK